MFNVFGKSTQVRHELAVTQTLIEIFDILAARDELCLEIIMEKLDISREVSESHTKLKIVSLVRFGDVTVRFRGSFTDFGDHLTLDRPWLKLSAIGHPDVISRVSVLLEGPGWRYRPCWVGFGPEEGGGTTGVSFPDFLERFGKK